MAGWSRVIPPALLRSKESRRSDGGGLKYFSSAEVGAGCASTSSPKRSRWGGRGGLKYFSSAEVGAGCASTSSPKRSVSLMAGMLSLDGIRRFEIGHSRMAARYPTEHVNLARVGQGI